MKNRPTLQMLGLAFALGSTGWAQVTQRVSVDSGGAQGNTYSLAPSTSADGRYVAFVSHATNLVPGDTNGVEDVFVRDRLSGATEWVSVDSGGAQGNNASGVGGVFFKTSISADGRYVAFASYATNLVPGDEVGRVARERHVAAVGGDGGLKENAADAAGVVPLCSARVDAHPLGCAAQPVADEDVLDAVRVPGDEVGRVAHERHVATVGGSRGGEAVGVPLRPARVHAHPLCHLCPACAPQGESETQHLQSRSVLHCSSPPRFLASVFRILCRWCRRPRLDRVTPCQNGGLVQLSRSLAFPWIPSLGLRRRRRREES